MSNNKTEDKAKPLIVLDGANIACAYKDTRPPGDATGIVQAFENYDSKGHKVICFVKQYRIRNERNPKAVMNNIELFNEKIPKDSIATVPGKSDDDSFFIDYCMKNGAVLITNDGLRDHEERFEGDEKRNTIVSSHNLRNSARSYVFIFLPVFFSTVNSMLIPLRSTPHGK